MRPEAGLVYEGMLATGAVTLTAGAAWCALTPRLLASPRGPAHAARALVVAGIGAHLLIAGLRQLAAYGSVAPETTWAGSLESADWHALDRELFLLATVVGALTVVPLAHLALVGARRPRAPDVAAALLLLAACIALPQLFAAPLDGPVLSQWASEWNVVDGRLNVALMLAFALPAAVSLGLLLRRPPPGQGRRLSVAFLVYYAVIVPDGFGLDGPLLLAARMGAATSALIAWQALRVPARVVVDATSA